MALREASFLSAPADVSASDLRGSFDALQEGVLGAGDLKVTARAEGANRSVDVAAGVGFIQGDTNPLLQRLYRGVNDAKTNSDTLADFPGGGIQAPDANPRGDRIVAEILDADFAGAERRWRLRVIRGNPVAGATLDTAGAFNAVPVSCMLLADVLVPVNGIIGAAQIRDRRPWARGVSFRVVRTANAGGTDDYSTPSSLVTLPAIDAVNLAARIECSGKPMVARLIGRKSIGTIDFHGLVLRMDGAAVGHGDAATSSESGDHMFVREEPITPPAGSHVFRWHFFTQNAAAPLTLQARNAGPLVMEIRDFLPSSSND